MPWCRWKRRLGSVERSWVALENVAPAMARSVVAAEDANFCNHWGFDIEAIRAAIEGGGQRGASTLSQQVVKNVYLWQGRNWLRKALEAVITPVVEAIWTKRRIIEVYLNVAEFDEGVFGVEAASRHYFGIGPDRLSPIQAARHAGYQNAKSASAKLIEQPHIKQAIALAQAEYAVASRVTKSEVIEGLKDAAERAKILDDTSSLVAAWREIGKMCGFYEPVKHEVSISVNGKVTLEKMAAMKDEELLALLDDDPNVLEGEFKQLPAPGDPDYDGE